MEPKRRPVTAIRVLENELFEQLWLNRHCNPLPETEDPIVYEAALERGEPMALRFGPPSPEIKRQAYDNAQHLLDKYGEEAILDNPYDYGFLEGQLSAIRWVLGFDDGLLDT